MRVYDAWENTSAKFTGTIVDEDGDAVPGSILESLTLSLTDLATAAVINSRNEQDVLGQNGVTVSEAGALIWTVDPDDNPILDDDRPKDETHLAVFVAVWPNGQATFGLRIRVQRVR